ncbi:MAG: hypothetical protein FWJ70_16330 [Micromonosporaceae bacterium]|mgnify:CR=1 FL=1|jgi:pilus assembly protein CpaB
MRASHGRRTGLEPVGRIRWPRAHTLGRMVAAALLLSTAAAVAWHGSGSSTLDADSGADGGAAAGESPPPPPPDGTHPAAPPSDGSRLAVPEGLVGVPVALGSPAMTALIRPGDRVDLLAVADTGPPVVVAAGRVVLGVDHADATLLVALTPEQAAEVVASPASMRFAVTIRSGE